MKSVELVESCRGLTYRKLDHWCRRGVFGADMMRPGSGSSRDFTSEDAYIAKVLGRVSLAMDEWSDGRGGCVPIYAAIATDLRSGSRDITIVLSDGVRLSVNVNEVLT